MKTVLNKDYQKDRFTVVREPQRQSKMWDPIQNVGKITAVKCQAPKFPNSLQWGGEKNIWPESQVQVFCYSSSPV